VSAVPGRSSAWDTRPDMVDCRSMDRDRQLASSFGAVATEYAEHRPDYSPAAVAWALQSAPGPRILDLGAGTGKLTAVLGAQGDDVVAVEPDAQMLDELRRRLPGVEALAGSAEALPLPDGSVDAVLAGHSMHWFEMGAAGPEIARVLRPGGVFAGLWNVLDTRVAWVAELARIAGPAAIGRRDTLRDWKSETAGLHLPSPRSLPRFGSAEQAEFPHGQLRTAESLIRTLGTKAGVLVMAEREREATLRQIRGFLANTPEAARGEFTLPMLTGVLRTRRL
jgi:SAM-dependent methyltransferase